MNWTFLKGARPALLTTLLLLAGATWWLTGLWQDHRTRAELDRINSDTEQRLAGLASDFERSLAHVRSVPLIIANEQVAAATLSVSHADTAGLNAYLGFIARITAVDLGFVIDAQGLCIASSNFDQADTLVGEHFADREYFGAARQGRTGVQYAVGRRTNIAGIFYSAPIRSGDRFLGVAVDRRSEYRAQPGDEGRFRDRSPRGRRSRQ